MHYLIYCMFYSQETSLLPHLSHSLVDVKWAWLEENVGAVKKSRTLRVLLSFGPSNLIHGPTPMKSVTTT